MDTLYFSIHPWRVPRIFDWQNYAWSLGWFPKALNCFIVLPSSCSLDLQEFKRQKAAIPSSPSSSKYWSIDLSHSEIPWSTFKEYFDDFIPFWSLDQHKWLALDGTGSLIPRLFVVARLQLAPINAHVRDSHTSYIILCRFKILFRIVLKLVPANHCNLKIDVYRAEVC